LTSGTANASIITSPVLNFPLSFPSNSNPSSFHVPASHHFSISANAPNFYAVLYSNVPGAHTFNRFANLYHGGHGTQFLNPHHDRIAAGKTWNQVFTTQGTYGRLADRVWGGVSTTNGLPAGTGFFELFRFTAGGQTDYGWIEYNVAMTEANSSLASNGPNITIVQYAWQTTPDTPLGAGVTQTGNVPEPAPFTETALGVLVLGAAALRRWRKSKIPA
jgi:MYXO-CTERM domain-containing protein